MAQKIARGYFTLVVTMALFGLVVAACVPGINSHQNVQAFIERVDETTVTGTLVLPADARLVMFEFIFSGERLPQRAAELPAGTHEFTVTTSGYTECYASGYLGENYFLLPCEPR